MDKDLNALGEDFLESGEPVVVPPAPVSTQLTNTRFQTIAFLAAKGLQPKDIAESLGVETNTITSIMASERMQFEVRQLLYKLHGTDIQKRFKELLPQAVDIAEEVMKNPNVKPAIKLAAAHNIMDRALGKPKQTMELEGSLIKQLFDKMDETRPKEVIQVFDIGATPAEPVKPSETKIEPKDETDSWVLENL